MPQFRYTAKDSAGKNATGIVEATDRKGAIDILRKKELVIVSLEEEKAKASQLAVDTKLKMLPLFEPFKLAQRYIALAFTVNFLLSFWVGVVLYVWFPTYLDGFLNIVGVYQLGWIMLAIISFYFGGGFLESFKKNAANK